MSATKNLRAFLAENNLQAADFTINATVSMERAFSKGDLDVYEPEVAAIVLSDGAITQVIDPSPAYDELARAVTGSKEFRLRNQSVPKGSTYSEASELIVLPLDLTMRRLDANWALQDATFDNTEGSEERFEDARWKVFTLTDEFAAKPCAREVFDLVSQEKDRLNDRSRFREFYAAWSGADESTVENGALTTAVREQVEAAVGELFLETDEDADRLKQIVYDNFKVHPRHRTLFDAVVDETIASRSQTLSR